MVVVAWQALASIRVRDVAQIQLASLRQATSDKSPYVRKVGGSVSCRPSTSHQITSLSAASLAPAWFGGLFAVGRSVGHTLSRSLLSSSCRSVRVLLSAPRVLQAAPFALHPTPRHAIHPILSRLPQSHCRKSTSSIKGSRR